MFGGTEIKLSDSFSAGRLMRFAFPSIIMMVVSSIYGVVDGIIISNFTGVENFAALNLILPYITILGASGLMLGTGGSALVGKILGEGDSERANKIFSLLTYTTIVVGVGLGLFGIYTSDLVASMLGADKAMQDLSYEYSSIMFSFLPFYVLQMYFQSLLTTAERPTLAMIITLVAGVVNVTLDLLFVAQFGWGLRGAAFATGISQIIGGFVPIIFFIYSRKHPEINLHLGSFIWSLQSIFRSCFNGLSESLMSISLAIVSFVYYYILLNNKGSIGVDTYGVLLYFYYVLIATLTEFSRGISPIISFHYGAKNKAELHDLLRKGLGIIFGLSILSELIAQVLASPIVNIFVGHNEELYKYTVYAFRIYSLHFAVTGFNIFISAFFTALNNGWYSGLISMLRTIVFECGCIIAMFLLYGIDRIWWGVTIAESITCILAFVFLLMKQKHYGY